jgi:polysaccharide pyruvyl transferase WcaK-like protein
VNLLLLEACNTYNYGSMMMVENFIHYSHQKDPEIQYYVVAEDEVHINRIKEATGLGEQIFYIKGAELFRNNSVMRSFILKKIFHVDVYSDLMKKMDKILVFGGDDYTEIYGMKYLYRQLCYTDAMKPKETYMALVGQSIGPFKRKFTRNRAFSLFGLMDMISLREHESYLYLKKYGFSNIVEMTDLALLPLAKEDSKAITKENTIILCPSELMYRHAKKISREEFIEFNIQLCRCLLNKGYKLILLPHVWDDMIGGDLAITKEIYQAVADKENILLVEEPVLPAQIRYMIRKSRLLIAERMHPAISCLECETPSLVFSYGRKYEGIFKKLYGLNELLIDIREYDDIKSLLSDCMKKLENIMQQYDFIVDRIKKKNNEAQPITREHIYNIVDATQK